MLKREGWSLPSLKKMGIAMQRGIEYLILLKPSCGFNDIEEGLKDISPMHSQIMYCSIFHAIIIFDSEHTDSRFMRTQHFHNICDKLLYSDMNSYTRLMLLDDFEVYDYEQALVEYVVSQPFLQGYIKEHGWFDVTRSAN